jgi:hypothetical protein
MGLSTAQKITQVKAKLQVLAEDPLTNDFKLPALYTIRNIRRGVGNRKRYVYAELHHETEGLIIAGTLDYIVIRVMTDKLGQE